MVRALPAAEAWVDRKMQTLAATDYWELGNVLAGFPPPAVIVVTREGWDVYEDLAALREARPEVAAGRWILPGRVAVAPTGSAR